LNDRQANDMEWDRADLEARLCRALDVSRRAVELFAENGYVDAELPENSFGVDKVVAETAMLIYIASAAGSPNVAWRLGEIAQLLLPHARSARTRLDMALHPALCLDFAFPHILLSELGYRDPAVDDLLKSCLSSRARDSHERPPFAAAEKLWVEQLLTGEQPGAAWRHCLRNSVLNRGLDILGGQRDDAYAFTHLLMYCTDFGFRAGKFPRKPSLILDEAASLLAKCLDAEDYDLAGEIVLAWPLTATPWPAAAAFGFRVLARVEDAVGVLPGGTTRPDRLDRLQGAEKNRYAFATAYHTAYVTGLLCAASLRPRRAPPVEMIGPPFNARLLDRLIDRIECDQGHWQAEFMRLNRSVQEALGPFLLDIVIAQKCRKRDYAAVSELLVMADKYQAARSPLCGQAAELLERLAAYAQTTQPRLVASNQIS
jgi:hypothetical protein